MIQSPIRKRDQTLIKIYGVGEYRKIKIITLNSLRVKGVEEHDYFDNPVDAAAYEDKLGRLKWQLNPDIDAVKDLYRTVLQKDTDQQVSLQDTDQKVTGEEWEKMRESKSRARAKIFELAFCNPWQWFFTGTLDKSKYDRSDLKKWHKDFTKWLHNYSVRKIGHKLDFLLIPELHADGDSWHMHGLINGLPADHLDRFELGQKMSSRLAFKVRQGEVCYNWRAYAEKFGFCDLEPVKDYEAVSKYCTKYITKSLQHSVKEYGAHLYYHSRGLQTSQLVAVGTFDDVLPAPEYSNDFCSVSWLPYSEELIALLRGQIGGVRYTETGNGYAACIPGQRGLADRE